MIKYNFILIYFDVLIDNSQLECSIVLIRLPLNHLKYKENVHQFLKGSEHVLYKEGSLFMSRKVDFDQ